MLNQLKLRFQYVVDGRDFFGNPKKYYRFHLDLTSHEEKCPVWFYLQVPEDERERQLKRFTEFMDESHALLDLTLSVRTGDVFTTLMGHSGDRFTIYISKEPVPISKELGLQIIEAYKEILREPFQRFES